MEFASKALPMTRQGLQDALQLLGLEPDQTAALWAIFDVETAGVTQGFGFRADKRPQILFERHKFRHFTEGRFNQAAPEISGEQGGYGPLAQQYPKLERALALCRNAGLPEELALKSTSWGIGQVMGFNYAAAGFPDARAMVGAMVRDEDAQLMAMARFMAQNGLDEALRSRDWEHFARVYNGPDYAAHQYDVKLANQYWRYISGSTPDIELRTVQAALLLLGYSPGKIDGVLGKRTREALKGAQVALGLAATGELTGETYASLYRTAFG